MSESMSTQSRSLLDWILDLLRDPDARDQFTSNPEQYAAQQGFEQLSAADVNDALCLAADSQFAGHEGRSGNWHIPPPPPPPARDHDSGHEGRDHDSGHRGDGGEHSGGDGAAYLRNYITNNYTTVEDHRTTIDNSVHQNIDTDGGSFDQVIDNDPVVASGEGSVAAGGDIRDSTVTSGEGNVVGDDNQAATGAGNTTAFGSGNATNATLDDVRFGDGAGVSLGGDASGTNSDSDTTTSVDNSGSGDTSVNAAGADGAANQYADQAQQDDSTHSNYEDNSTTGNYNEANSHNSNTFDDSHNYDAGTH